MQKYCKNTQTSESAVERILELINVFWTRVLLIEDAARRIVAEIVEGAWCIFLQIYERHHSLEFLLRRKTDKTMQRASHRSHPSTDGG